MSCAFNLEISSSRVKVDRIVKLRPFPEIPHNRIKKQTAYEEFWLTDFELSHMNGQEKEDVVDELVLDGLGFETPSTDSPMVLQAGRRTAIDDFLNSKVFPYELNAILYQGDLEGLDYLHNKEHTHVELNKLAL